jgi:hypothetical protein
VSTLLSLLMASQTQDAVNPKTQREMVVDRSTIRTWRYVASFAVIAAALAVSAYAWRGATQVEQIYVESRSPERAALHAKTAATHFTMGHYGDYALIMLAGDNATLDLFGRTTRTLIDERLLLAWARAYAREGETERAQFLFDRAREFSALRDQIAPSSNTETQPRAAASKPFGARDFRF